MVLAIVSLRDKLLRAVTRVGAKRLLSPFILVEGLTAANNLVADRLLNQAKQVSLGRRAPRKKPSALSTAIEATNDIAASISARILAMVGEAADVLTPFDTSTTAGSIAESISDIPRKELAQLEAAVERMIDATRALREAEEKIRFQTPRRR